MTALLILGAMALGGAALLLLPLATRRRDPADRAAFDRAVFRDQLDELDRDVARGVINESDAQAARIEIERRILATASPAAQTGPEPGAAVPHHAKGSRVLIVTLSALVVPVAGVIYLALGSPDLPGEPFAERAPAGPTMAQIGRMVDALERRLEEKPDEIQGWSILTAAYLRLGRKADAEKAVNRALALAGADKARGAEIATNYGEALVSMAGGQVGPRAKAAFTRALELAPKHPAAGYYLGLAQLQAGDVKGALGIWRRITKDAPKDAPWLAELRQRIEKIAKDQGISPEKTTAEPGR